MALKISITVKTKHDKHTRRGNEYINCAKGNIKAGDYCQSKNCFYKVQNVNKQEYTLRENILKTYYFPKYFFTEDLRL